MAITLDKDLGSDDSGSSTFTTTQTAASATIIVLTIGWFHFTTTLSSVSGGGLSWSIDRQVQSTSDSWHIAIVSAKAASGLTLGAVITPTFSAGLDAGPWFGGSSWLGLDQTTWKDQTNTNSQTTTSWDSNSVTPSVANELIFHAGITGAGATGSAPFSTHTSPATQLHSAGVVNDHFWCDGYKIVASTSAVSIAGTWDSVGGGNDAHAIVSYEQASSSFTGFTNTVPPTVTGNLQVGSTVTANPGTWSPVPGSFAYYWRRADDTSGTNLVEIGATGSTYTLSAADGGKYIQAGVIPSQ